MACSMPPIYWSTGSQYSTSRFSNAVSARGEQKRAKYQEDSKKVSKVSVSRRAAPPQLGQLTYFQVGCRSSGLPGWSKLTSSGSLTGGSCSGTGTSAQDGQRMIGIGQPQ